MKIGEQFDLTYCSNIHAGERWDDVSAALTESLPHIRRDLGHTGAFAIGLRLSAEAAHTLEQPGRLTEFAAFLAGGGYYVPTINGFPYGAFHGTRVKERVYQPDWRTAERLDYSNRLARILAALARPGDDTLSVSTVPGAFRAGAGGPADAEAIAAGMLAHAAALADLRDRTGVSIALAIEPEPACFIETVGEAVRFFRDYLFDPARMAAAARAAGSALSEDAVRRHLGVCLDTCHMAVEFEDPAEAVRDVLAAGIRIAKVQLSSALRVTPGGQASPHTLLERFADDTYLHQVVIEGARGLTRYTDLPEALGLSRDGGAPAGEWRVHFHVPIFLEAMQGFDTTQAYIAAMIEVLRTAGVRTCLEVETYTWDVLPPEYRTSDVATAIARELAWVRARLAH